MRARFEKAEARKKASLLDRVRDKEFNTKQRWLRCRLHWFGDPEFRRGEMEKELQRVLVDSKRVTEEVRKPVYDPHYSNGGEYRATYQLGLNPEINQELTAEFEALADSVAAFRQPIILGTDAPLAGFLEGSEKSASAAGSTASASNSSSSAYADKSHQSGGFSPETSMLFEPYYPQHGQQGRKITQEQTLFGSYKSLFEGSEEIRALTNKVAPSVAAGTKEPAAEASDFSPAAASVDSANTSEDSNFAPPASETFLPVVCKVEDQYAHTKSDQTVTPDHR